MPANPPPAPGPAPASWGRWGRAPSPTAARGAGGGGQVLVGGRCGVAVAQRHALAPCWSLPTPSTQPSPGLPSSMHPPWRRAAPAARAGRGGRRATPCAAAGGGPGAGRPPAQCHPGQTERRRCSRGRSDRPCLRPAGWRHGRVRGSRPHPGRGGGGWVGWGGGHWSRSKHAAMLLAGGRLAWLLTHLEDQAGGLQLQPALDQGAPWDPQGERGGGALHRHAPQRRLQQRGALAGGAGQRAGSRGGGLQLGWVSGGSVREGGLARPAAL